LLGQSVEVDGGCSPGQLRSGFFVRGHIQEVAGERETILAGEKVREPEVARPTRPQRSQFQPLSSS
jgi:hypothetical protein